MIHQYFWSETLFLALSIGAACLAVGLASGTRRRRDWILFLLLLAVSGTVRYMGAANLALIAPIIFQRETMRGAWHLLTQRRVLMGALIGGGLLAALSLSADVWGSGRDGIGPIQWLGILLGAAGLLVGLAGLVLPRKRPPSGMRSGGEGTRPDATRPNAHTWALLAVAAAAAPPLVWWARNRFLYGVFSLVNSPFEIFQAFKLWAPFEYAWNDLLDVGRYQRPLLAMLAAFLLLLPLLRKPISRTREVRRTAQIVLLSAAAAHFAVVWSLSLVATVEAVGARYFSPVLAFLLLGTLNGVQQAADLARARALRGAISALPLALLAVAAVMSPTTFLPSVGPVNYPRERQLWREIDRIEWTRSSSCFYTDVSYSAGGLLHQIFSGRPQGIIWDTGVLRDPETLRHILSNGVNPFILVKENGYEAGILNEMSASGVVPLERILFHDTGFALYYLRR
jgi:hypothetical protein